MVFFNEGFPYRCTENLKHVHTTHKYILDLICIGPVLLTGCYLQDEFLSVVSRLGLEVVRWETTQRCSTHYFTLLRRKQSAVDSHSA